MPRGQESGTVQGGALSPYVQQSLQAGKQQAENRLLSATQEAGATGRTQMQEAGATDRTQLQIQGQRRMQAAELEAQDKRSAEAERARQEDRVYQKMLQDDQQLFLAEQSRAEQDFMRARAERDYEREDEALQRAMDLQTAQARMAMQVARQRDKVVMAIAELSQQKETAQLKVQSQLAEDAEQAEQMMHAHEFTRDRVVEAMKRDKRLDAPLSAMVERPERKIQMFGGGAGYIMPGVGPEATPMGVVQDQLRANGSNVSVGDLLQMDGAALAKQIAEGKVQMSSIQATASVLDGAVMRFAERMEEAPNKKERDFWHEKVSDMKQARLTLSHLLNDKTKVSDSETETVGSVVRNALGPIDGFSTGSEIARMKTLHATMTEAVEARMQEIRGSMNAFAPVPVGGEDSPYLLDYLSRINGARSMTAPKTNITPGG